MLKSLGHYFVSVSQGTNVFLPNGSRVTTSIVMCHCPCPDGTIMADAAALLTILSDHKFLLQFWFTSSVFNHCTTLICG